MTATIPLHGKHGQGLVTLVDDEDALAVGEYLWYCTPRGYVKRCVGSKIIYLHRVLAGLSPGDGLEVDHVDLDRLNNRRSNLRVTRHAENAQNQRSRPGTSSPHRGVSWSRQMGRWRAFGKVGGRWKHLGYYDDPEAAAAAAREWRQANMTHTVEGDLLVPR